MPRLHSTKIIPIQDYELCVQNTFECKKPSTNTSNFLKNCLSFLLNKFICCFSLQILKAKDVLLANHISYSLHTLFNLQSTISMLLIWIQMECKTNRPVQNLIIDRSSLEYFLENHSKFLCALWFKMVGHFFLFRITARIWFTINALSRKLFYFDR